VALRVTEGELPATASPATAEGIDGLWLRIEHARLRLLRGFEELLCLDGLHGVERLPHQVETVRRVLRHFRAGVLLADEVGLGKTIEAGLLLREYLLRGMVKRVLILVPPALVGQWHEELSTKFGLEFAVAESSRSLPHGFWQETNRVLSSLSLAKSARHFEAVSASSWDMVVVDEAHHCRNRTTRNWQLVNALKRKRMLLLTATPVQNDLMELYNLLTLLEPGHLKTEVHFKKNYVRRGNPRDPLNRERLRELLGQVMIRNTRSLVNVNLPPRYAQTFVVQPDDAERQVYESLETYLRRRIQGSVLEGEVGDFESAEKLHFVDADGSGESTAPELFGDDGAERAQGGRSARPHAPGPSANRDDLSRRRITALLAAAGSHPAALAAALAGMEERDGGSTDLTSLTRRAATIAVDHSPSTRTAKESKLIELLQANPRNKILVFANFTATLERLQRILTQEGVAFSLFTGRQSAAEKAQAVEQFADRLPVMLCSEIGGEGHNLQFANTLINFDLPWNPMRIEQRVGRIHRIGQTRDVFIFNLCTAGSLEQRILRLLHEKIRMFELVVGEVGSILGNLEGGDEFESLVLNLWLESPGPRELDQAFEKLGDSLLTAQEEYLETKRLDEALFGDEYE
jgi:SNF2 family DNA or RNA helicase